MALERTALNIVLERPHGGAIVWFSVALGTLFSAVLNDIFYHGPLYLHGENREETTFSCWCLLDLSFCGSSFR